MLQDIVNYIKKIAKEELSIEITDNMPPPKDQQRGKSLYVILTSSGTRTSDMCGNIYNTDTLRIMGVTPNINSNIADEITIHITEIQTVLDNLGKKLVDKTRKGLVTLSPATDIILFDPKYSISYAGLDSAVRHVYELTLEVQWLSTNQ